MKNVIAICNQKGGVGKTTTAANLGSALQMMGKKVLLIDCDPQANLSTYLDFDVDNDEGPTLATLLNTYVSASPVGDLAKEAIRHNEANELDYIPADISLSATENSLLNAISRERALSSILSNEAFDKYNYILLDCLPSLGILLFNALSAANGIIIPVQTQKFALNGLTTLLDICNQIKNAINNSLEIIGILPTMVDNTNVSKNTLQTLQEHYKNELFQTHISKSVEAAKSAESLIMLPRTKNKLGEEYKALCKEVEKRCKKIQKTMA